MILSLSGGMRRTRSAFLCAALCLLVCLGARVPDVCARQVEITLIHTTDLHGHLLPVRDYDGREGQGGLLRCASVIQDIRADSPHALLVDCGDLIQGGAESWLSRGEVMVRALEQLDYDAWVLGNHEFDWGPKVLRSLHDGCDVPMLAANIRRCSGCDHPLPRVRPFVIREVDGIRVAIVGLTTPAIPLWISPEGRRGLLFESAVDALSRVLPSVRAQKPQIIVAAVHQGIREFADDDANEIHRIARQFPELDVILGGHTHQAHEEVSLGGLLYSQAGYHGQYVGRVDLVYDTVSGGVVRKRARLVPVDESTPECEELKASVGGELAAACIFAESIVGTAACEIASSVALPGQSPAQQLVARAIAERVDAEVVLHGAFGEQGLPAGPVRNSDIWEAVPYENQIGVLLLTAGQIREVLEENVRYAGSARFLGVHGISYDLCRNAKEGSRVSSVCLSDGTTPHGRRKFRVAVSSYALSSGGGRYRALSRFAQDPSSCCQMTDIDTRSAVIDYVRNHSPLCIETGQEVRVRRDAD